MIRLSMLSLLRFAACENVIELKPRNKTMNIRVMTDFTCVVIEFGLCRTFVLTARRFD
jgi:hypothetical protein